MNVQLLGQFLTGLNYIGRNPSRREFIDGSPSEQRAIRTRWKEIASQSQCGSNEWKEAIGNLEYTKPQLLLIDNKNMADRDYEFFSAQEQFLRGGKDEAAGVGPDTDEDAGL